MRFFNSIKPNTIAWFLNHELRLSWRDVYAMMTGNRPGRGRNIVIAISVAIFLLHLLAYSALGPILAEGMKLDLQTYIMISGFLLLPVSLMASQAMESITRAFYTRSDLELILSSPAPVHKIFALRICAIAFSTTLLTLGICAPAINVLALFNGVAWLWAYPVIVCFGFLATSFGVFLTMALFKILGPRNTRVISQIVAAFVGASFVIGIQLVAIASIGSISRISFLKSKYIMAVAPNLDHWIWIPAKASSGDMASIATFIGLTIIIFGLMLILYARQFGETVLEASSGDISREGNSKRKVKFISKSATSVLRQKEWKVLLRDKWLFSQTLMQLFYLVPPAYMLWQGFGSGQSPAYVVIAVVVMAAGQLAGGLAWLAISGEDAPELVATAPVSNTMVTRAKVEAVLIAVGVVVSPIVLLIAFLSIKIALLAIVMIAISCASATLIQLWFRTQASRSHFRKRQTSSKIATIAEAFSSILWAGTASLFALGTYLAIIPAVLTVLILLFVWWLSPARQKHIDTRQQLMPSPMGALK